MGKYKIDVKYPKEKMIKNRQRFQSAFKFKPVDRTPVLFGIFERYLLNERKIGYLEFFSDSKTMLHHSILDQVWAIENIPDDRCQDNLIQIYPNWENVLVPGSFGAEVLYLDDQPPYSKPIFTSPDEIFKFEIPQPDTGLWGKNIKYFLEWQELINDYEITFNDEPGRIEMLPLNYGKFGSFLTAVSLAGQQFYTWLYEYPQACHILLNKITSSITGAELKCREVDPRLRSSFDIAEDFAELISEKMFKEFCVPYDNKLFDIIGKDNKTYVQNDAFGFGLRGLHNCGNSTHLLDSFINDLKITGFLLFGSSVKTSTVAEKMGGRAYLWGNLKCNTLLFGPDEEIYKNTLELLKAFSGYNGVCLGDGSNVCPGTPLENLNKVVLTAEEFYNL